MSRLFASFMVISLVFTAPAVAQDAKPADPPKAKPDKPTLTPEQKAARREARQKALAEKAKNEAEAAKNEGTKEGANVEPISGPQPKCELSTTDWNFGSLWYGDPAETDIRIENKGDAPLEIKAVKTSCGCTAAKPKVDRLEPGTGDVISLTYNTKKNVKNVMQYVTVETNDPRQPAIRIKVQGTVRNLVECEPRSIALGQITRDYAEPRTVTITNELEDKIDFKLDERTDQIKFWDFKLEETEQGKVWKLTATPRPPLSYGSQNFNIALVSTNERVGTYNIQMVGSVPHRIESTPRVLQRLPGNEEFSIRVVNRDPSKPIEVKNVDTGHPDIKAEVRESKVDSKTGEQSIEIVLNIPKAVELPRNGARIKISTNADEPQYQTVQTLVRDQGRPRAAGADKLTPEEIEKIKQMKEAEAEADNPGAKMKGKGKRAKVEAAKAAIEKAEAEKAEAEKKAEPEKKPE
ncbi:MAG: DUF1573 domain-containing protein [Phycisphaerales bacterium]|nr:DUF1573 domain-containing protein [Phycisphaerales bacterium]